MAKIILVTAGESAVRETLMRCFDSVVLDWHVLGSRECFMFELDRILSSAECMIVCYRCPYIFPIELLGKAKLGAYNIHPSLLPKYKGLNPWEDIIANGERESGVTLHIMTEEADSGPIICQRTFRIPTNSRIEELRNIADTIADTMLRETILKEYALC